MDEQNTGGLQCMVWHNNNRAEEMSWSKEGKMSFSGCKWKILVWFKHIFYPNIYVSETLSL